MLGARIAVAAALATASLLVAASPAGAHAGDDRGPSNHRIVLVTPEPADGVTARLIEAGTRIELVNEGTEDVVVLGYDGEPYLRVGADGVAENRRSPATYLNATYAGGDVPPDADADAPPEWVEIDDGRTARWHDHRFHPPRSGPVDDDRRQVVTAWEIPLLVGGSPVAVAGEIEWVPPPPAWPWWLAAGAVAAAAVAAAVGTGLGAVFVAAAVAVVADLVRAVGIAGEVGGWSSAADVAGISAAGWLLAALAVVLARAHRPNDAAVAVALAGAVIAVAGGVLELGDLGTSQLPSLLPAPLARAAIAAALGAGAGTAVGGALFLLRPPTR